MSIGKTKTVSIRYVYRDSKDESGPLYCQITFDRNSTRFKLHDSKAKYDAQKEEWIKQIILFEAAQIGDSYHIKGIADRIRFYERPALILLSAYVEGKLLAAVQHALTYIEYQHLIAGLPSGDKFDGDYFNYFNVAHYLWTIKNDFKKNLPELLNPEAYQLIQAFLLFALYENQQIKGQSKRGQDFREGVSLIGNWLMHRNEAKNKFAAFLEEWNSTLRELEIVGAQKKFFLEVVEDFPFKASDIKFIVNQLDFAITQIKDRHIQF